jgi:hypothetical protein
MLASTLSTPKHLLDFIKRRMCHLAARFSSFVVVFQHESVWLIQLTWRGGGSVDWLVRPVPMKWGKNSVPVKGGKQRARQETQMIQACEALGKALK